MASTISGSPSAEPSSEIITSKRSAGQVCAASRSSTDRNTSLRPQDEISMLMSNTRSATNTVDLLDHISERMEEVARNEGAIGLAREWSARATMTLGSFEGRPPDRWFVHLSLKLDVSHTTHIPLHNASVEGAGVMVELRGRR
jgi:hypothetical protein